MSHCVATGLARVGASPLSVSAFWRNDENRNAPVPVRREEVTLVAAY